MNLLIGIHSNLEELEQEVEGDYALVFHKIMNMAIKFIDIPFKPSSISKFQGIFKKRTIE